MHFFGNASLGYRAHGMERMEGEEGIEWESTKIEPLGSTEGSSL